MKIGLDKWMIQLMESLLDGSACLAGATKLLCVLCRLYYNKYYVLRCLSRLKHISYI
jgi:hypothetical protein